MSSRNAHIRQARHNEALEKELVSGGYRYRDWAVVQFGFGNFSVL